MPRSHSVDDDFPPILCNKCHQEIRETVHVAVQIPVGWRNLTKIGLRSRRILIQAVDWEPRQISCGCGLRPVAVTPPATGPTSHSKISLAAWRYRNQQKNWRDAYLRRKRPKSDKEAQEAQEAQEAEEAEEAQEAQEET